MDKNSIIRYKTSFDDIAQYIEGDNGEQVEVWFARDLMPVLGYARWENFQSTIGRAIDSCKSQNISMDDHFREVTKMVSLGSGSEREIGRLHAHPLRLLTHCDERRPQEGRDSLCAKLLCSSDP